MFELCWRPILLETRQGDLDAFELFPPPSVIKMFIARKDSHTAQ